MTSYGFPLNLKKHISFFPLDAAVIRVLEAIRDVPILYPPALLAKRREAFMQQIRKPEQAVTHSGGSKPIDRLRKAC